MTMSNKTFCLAEDIVKRVLEVLTEAPKPKGFEDLSIFVSPEIPLETEDLPAICIDVDPGDQADLSEKAALPHNGKFVGVLTVITLNYRVNIEGQDNNGIAAISPLYKWSMRHLPKDPELKAMSLRPIQPCGWGQPYGDTHEIAYKGKIQKLLFTHVLNIETAWDE